MMAGQAELVKAILGGAATALRLKMPLRDTQGSSCLATLGFGPESRWDSPKGAATSTIRFRPEASGGQVSLRLKATARQDSGWRFVEPVCHFKIFFNRASSETLAAVPAARRTSRDESCGQHST